MQFETSALSGIYRISFLWTVVYRREENLEKDGMLKEYMSKIEMHILRPAFLNCDKGHMVLHLGSHKVPEQQIIIMGIPEQGEQEDQDQGEMDHP